MKTIDLRKRKGLEYGEMTGEDLKKIRASLKLTQQKLAEKVGVARNTINRWEMGTRRIPRPMEHLLRMLDAAPR